ncbi:MAG: hypothetical protein LJE85_12160 [Gammaproteobacteria bacterium]|jgi:hypothetical protein|nr:hypothetical protein [Gammaproteobacteria bacterium]
MTVEPATQNQASAALITAFAETQMSDYVRQHIDQSTFLELAACAFFCGAEAQFRKLSKLNWRDSQARLIDVVMDVGNISKSKTIALINAIHRLADKFYLIENIVEQGKTAADQWLNCQDEDLKPLQALVSKYENLTMFDLGIEGINEDYDDQQQVLYASVDQSVGKLRRRALVILLIITSLAASISVSLQYL